MKTNCNLRASLHSLISSTPTGAPSSSVMTSDTPTGTPTNNNTTDYPDITAVPRTGNCCSCCCAVLMLRFVADCCDDHVAFSEDARRFLKKYPLD